MDRILNQFSFILGGVVIFGFAVALIARRGSSDAVVKWLQNLLENCAALKFYHFLASY